MSYIITSNGIFQYSQHLLYLGAHYINKNVLIENLVILSGYLDRIGINWGPAFSTLIGIVRGNDILPWANVFNIYILREDEERFKDVLLALKGEGFTLMRYERRGLYYLERKGEFFKIFILRKISTEVRHTGGTDFIYDKFVHNTIKWSFEGIELNVPESLDEYLTFQYGNWILPVESNNRLGLIKKYIHCGNKWLQDCMPDTIYYKWLKWHRKKGFLRFKNLCKKNGCPLPVNVELSNIRPRRYKKVLTVGVYDLIHKGHVELYRRAKGLGDYLIVAVQDGDFILKYKPQAKVLNTTEDRIYMVQSIKYVDETIVYCDVDDIVKHVNFDIFVTGPDQCHEGFKRAIRWCEENGKEHIILGRTDGVSSSELKEKIANKIKSK